MGRLPFSFYSASCVDLCYCDKKPPGRWLWFMRRQSFKSFWNLLDFIRVILVGSPKLQ